MSSEETPEIIFTVIIATCDRVNNLLATLEAIQISIDNSGLDHRIIVVDNGMKQPVDAVVSEYSRATNGYVEYLKSTPGCKSRALNVGVKAATTDWLAFTDDDTMPDGRWLIEAGEYAGKTGVSVFGGRIIHGVVDSEYPSWIRASDSASLLRGPAIVTYEPLAGDGFIDERAQVPLGANLFARKGVYEKYGYYDETLWASCGKVALGCEDAEFGMRIRDVGMRIGYCSEAVVVHPISLERARMFVHITWSYKAGVREVILFPDAIRGTLFSLRSAVGSLLKALVYAVGGRMTKVVACLMSTSFAIGCLVARIRRMHKRRT